MYGVGILGNCATHGAATACKFIRHPKTRVVTGYERNTHRAEELQEAMDTTLAASYEQVIQHPEVQIVVVTTDPCDKADMVEIAAEQGKALFVNKPLCHSPSAARRIVQAVCRYGIPAVFDATMVKFLPAFDKLMREVQSGSYGKVVSYYHSLGVTCAENFPIKETWPERLDSPSKTGGGEMTNMGCYAIDYALSMLGMPKRVEARWQKFLIPYVETDVENFGQIFLDYGHFWAVLAVGRQAVQGEPGPRNALTIEFESANLFLDPGANVFIENGHARSLNDYEAGHQCESPIDQLLRCIEHGGQPNSDVETAAKGVEVLCAAYKSILENHPVSLPLKEARNPLFE